MMRIVGFYCHNLNRFAPFHPHKTSCCEICELIVDENDYRENEWYPVGGNAAIRFRVEESFVDWKRSYR